MTSIEWLINELYTEMNMSGDGRVLDEILEDAKEMHKKEIIDAWIATDNELQRIAAEQYYQETFVSKGSDEHHEDNLVEIPTSSQTTSDKWKEYQDWLNEPPEISDEEIEKFADEELGTIRTDFDFGVIQGMKWYREQLKQRQ